MSQEPALPPCHGGVIGGLLAGLFGVGGGVIMVPLLLWWAELDQCRAQATLLVTIAPRPLGERRATPLEACFRSFPGSALQFARCLMPSWELSYFDGYRFSDCVGHLIVFAAAMETTVM